jgi:hypothetical protein
MKSISILLAVSLVTFCNALEDTKENRASQADRYLKVNPPSEQFGKIVTSMVRDLPESQKENWTKLMPENLDEKTLTKEMKELLIKTFSAGELKALADLYSTPEGRSALEKLQTYQATTSGLMNRAMRSAIEKTRAQLRKNGPPKDRKQE